MYNWAGKPSVGQLGWFQTSVLLVHPDDVASLSNAADALASLLKEEGFEAAREVGTNSNASNKNAIHVVVGQKR